MGLVVKSHTSFKWCVSLGGVCVDLFVALQGFHQGAPTSMIGFNIYDDVLVRSLKQCIVGLAIGDIRVPAPAYADDVVVMATNVNAIKMVTVGMSKLEPSVWYMKVVSSDLRKCTTVVRLLLGCNKLNTCLY